MSKEISSPPPVKTDPPSSGATFPDLKSQLDKTTTELTLLKESVRKQKEIIERYKRGIGAVIRVVCSVKVPFRKNSKVCEDLKSLTRGGNETSIEDQFNKITQAVSEMTTQPQKSNRTLLYVGLLFVVIAVAYYVYKNRQPNKTL